MYKKSKISAQELLAQFNSEITNGICNLRSYEDVSKRLDIFINSFPNEKSMAMIYDLLGRDNEHLEHWVNLKFDSLASLPETHKGLVFKLYQSVFEKRLMKSRKHYYIFRESFAKLMTNMELFSIIEIWLKANLENKRIDTDDIVTNMCDFINDGYNLRKIDFNKIYTDYAEEKFAA